MTTTYGQELFKDVIAYVSEIEAENESLKTELDDLRRKRDELIREIETLRSVLRRP